MYYINEILAISEPYMVRDIGIDGVNEIRRRTAHMARFGNKRTVQEFSRVYCDYIKERFQSDRKPTRMDSFLAKDTKKVKIVWGNCLTAMQSMQSESVHLMVTSPPYYNARSYSQWKDINAYLDDMMVIITEAYRVLDNHRAFVFNVGDITSNDNLHTKSIWGSRRIPLGAYFINIFEEVGFQFVDDFIWDKGQVESQRHKNGDTPHPFYQYPMNCYEHIMVFFKHRKDETRYPCPVCGCLKTNGNAYSGVGVKSWECKNLECFERSKSNRGKRFSMRSMMMDSLKTNMIDSDFVKQWRRDIILLHPIVKINCKGENTLGHTAPYPPAIPEFAVRMYSGEGDIVIDPFAGSFTSAIEACRLGRIGVGIELQKELFYRPITSNIRKHGLEFESIEWKKKKKANHWLPWRNAPCYEAS